MTGEIVRIALAEFIERRAFRLRKNELGRGRVEFLLSRFHGEKYRPRMDALESERARLESEIKSAKEALNMSKKNEIKLDRIAVYDAARRGERDGAGCDATIEELHTQMRELAPTLPDDPWDALAVLLGAYVTSEARGNQDPLAAYDAARAALRALPTFAEIEERVAADIGRALEPNECAAIIGTLDAVSHGLVETLRLAPKPEQKPIGIPDPPPPPPTKAANERCHVVRISTGAQCVLDHDHYGAHSFEVES